MMMPLPELNTRSVRDVVEENFKKLGLKTYAIRMIYIGEHTLPKEEIIDHFTKSMKATNASYCDIHVYGLLLVYDSYFVHILEGSEDSIHRQIRFLFKQEAEWIADMEKLDRRENGEEGTEGLTVLMTDDNEPKPERKMFRRLKTVMTYHSIRTLEFDNWRVITARPPSLIGNLNIYGPLQEHLEQLRIFLNKITNICAFAKADENLSFEGLRVIDPKMEALPEVALLDFLLQSPLILQLRDTAGLHRRVDDIKFYFEDVWALPSHFTPRHLYKLKADDSFVEPLPVMPWELVDEEKEEREEASDGSSTD